ncbi:DUF883 family protein [Aquamicrobium zhengzhouense]|uniref:DUF883 domain-containing protein n=1 Tax=Aquamicrobium zhengzhouense TaxID=2781738 RepID=A0ABS0SFM1_9HYPH|nr:DUF883 family protein [Aquamicrobium zhengzhouense]MBI1621415.1 DUF883 domain-containing protein [Aquamicrobium zhengzhouense]
MAVTPRAGAGGVDDFTTGSPADLEAEIKRLREDVAKLADQLAKTSEHTYSAARRVASEGADHLRAKGEAAVDAIRSNASDIEEQISDAVREKPITALAIAAGIGYLLAVLRR